MVQIASLGSLRGPPGILVSDATDIPPPHDETSNDNESNNTSSAGHSNHCTGCLLARFSHLLLHTSFGCSQRRALKRFHRDCTKHRMELVKLVSWIAEELVLLLDSDTRPNISRLASNQDWLDDTSYDEAPSHHRLDQNLTLVESECVGNVLSELPHVEIVNLSHAEAEHNCVAVRASALVIVEAIHTPVSSVVRASLFHWGADVRLGEVRGRESSFRSQRGGS
mmetsp:Transcript_12058/g.14364  ORF Transcript_12058/g.14364 Transcript_12058/m.14364 type:complete len:224 (+) Transcript_12058:147-818(+)